MNTNTKVIIDQFNRGEIGLLDALETAREACAEISRIRWADVLATDAEILGDWCEPEVAAAIAATVHGEYPSDWLAEFLPSESWHQHTGAALTKLEPTIGEDGRFLELCSALILAERTHARSRWTSEYGTYTTAA